MKVSSAGHCGLSSTRRILLLLVNVGLVLTVFSGVTYAQKTQMKPAGVTDESTIPKPNVPITGTAAETGIGMDSPYHVRIEFCNS